MKYLICVVIILIGLISCEKEEDIKDLSNKIEFADFAVSEISYKTAKLSSKIPDNYGVEIIQFGHCWSLEANPDINDSISIFSEYLPEVFTSNLQNLKHNSTYYVRAYFKVIDVIFYNDEITFQTLEINLPEVITGTISSIRYSSVQLGGEVTSANGGDIITRGVCWNKLGSPDLFDNHSEDSIGLGGFECNVENLELNTKYYINAFAINEAGVAYGNEKEFITRDGRPIINTVACSEITFNSLKTGCEVISYESSVITEKGICWNTTGSPEITDFRTDGGSGSESFDCYIENLQEGESYYLRTYAINDEGIAYGNELSVSLVYGEIQIQDYDENWYNTVEIGDQIWLKENLKTTHYPDGTLINDGTRLNIENESLPAYYFAYDDDESNVEVYGRLYTWYAAINACPDGWHVPTKSDWDILIDDVGIIEAGKLKSIGTIEDGTGLWKSPNLGATNEYGLNIVPTGFRNSFYSSYSDKGEQVIYNYSDNSNAGISFYYLTDGFGGAGVDEKGGHPVRCIKD